MALRRTEDHYAAIRQTADQLADLQIVLRLIDVVVEEVFAETSLRRRAAAILHRLAELIADGARPRDSEAFPLNGHDA